MMTASADPSESIHSRFYEELGAAALMPFWAMPPEAAPRPEPSRRVRPCLWRWQAMRPQLITASELVSLEAADRRALLMANPSLPAPNTTRSLTAGMSIVLPGEAAPSHRHTPAALRLIVESDGAATIVNGEPLLMERGDLVLTPPWSWHGHINHGSGPAIWLDILDAGLVTMLDCFFYEELSEPRSLQAPTVEAGACLRQFGAAGLIPGNGIPASADSPLLVYKWSQARQALESAAGPHDDVVVLNCSNPLTGGPILPTMDASIHLLPAHSRTTARQRTANAIYHVLEGDGWSAVDGERFEWKQGDTFCVPTWCSEEHVAGEGGRAILFACTDSPVLHAMGLYRERIK